MQNKEKNSIRENKQAQWFFEKVNKSEELITRLTNTKKENQITKLRNEKIEILLTFRNTNYKGTPFLHKLL